MRGTLKVDQARISRLIDEFKQVAMDSLELDDHLENLDDLEYLAYALEFFTNMKCAEDEMGEAEMDAFEEGQQA